MKNVKMVVAFICMASVLCMNVFAQQGNSKQTEQKTETTVEQEYLSTVEDVIISELAAATDRDSKQVALQYLESALESGRSSPDMYAALDSLAGEGVVSQSRTSGRIANNFPDIRAKACQLLGKLGTEEAVDTLVKITLADNEPMVATEAIRSLGNIGINNNDEVVATIAWTQKKYAVLNPTSSMALEVLLTYEKLAPTVQDRKEMIQSISEIATNYSYVTPVRQKALGLLKTLSAK